LLAVVAADIASAEVVGQFEAGFALRTLKDLVHCPDGTLGQLNRYLFADVAVDRVVAYRRSTVLSRTLQLVQVLVIVELSLDKPTPNIFL
jgi:hypothetical protein